MFGHGPAGTGQLYVSVDGSSASYMPLKSVCDGVDQPAGPVVEADRDVGQALRLAVVDAALVVGQAEVVEVRPQKCVGIGTGVNRLKFGAVAWPARTVTSLSLAQGRSWPSNGLPPPARKFGLVDVARCAARRRRAR